MKLRGIDFGYVLGASGVQGFFGEGYWYHKYLHLVGMTLRGMSLVAKTTTMYPRKGNMEVGKDRISPRRWIPDCIHLDWKGFCGGYALNAIGLTGPGALDLIRRGKWQRLSEPFMLSFMSVEKDPVDRSEELRSFVGLLKMELDDISSKFALQINLSCPNTDNDPLKLVKEAERMLHFASELRIPILLKISVEVSPEVAAKIAKSPYCDGIVISNTVKFGKLKDKIDWLKLYGVDRKEKSPLAKYGGGGLSGAPLNKLVEEWVIAFRKIDKDTYINAGGGILGYRSGKRLFDAGANSVFIGSMVMLRPWWVTPTIFLLNQYGTWKENQRGRS